MEKGEHTFRIGFQNFNGLTGKENNPVDSSLRNWITDNSFDVFGLSEVNLYWPKVRKQLQFHERVGKGGHQAKNNQSSHITGQKKD